METLPDPKHKDSLVFVADHEVRNAVFLRRCVMGERVGREGVVGRSRHSHASRHLAYCNRNPSNRSQWDSIEAVTL